MMTDVQQQQQQRQFNPLSHSTTNNHNNKNGQNLFKCSFQCCQQRSWFSGFQSQAELQKHMNFHKCQWIFPNNQSLNGQNITPSFQQLETNDPSSLSKNIRLSYSQCDYVPRDEKDLLAHIENDHINTTSRNSRQIPSKVFNNRSKYFCPWQTCTSIAYAQKGTENRAHIIAHVKKHVSSGSNDYNSTTRKYKSGDESAIDNEEFSPKQSHPSPSDFQLHQQQQAYPFALSDSSAPSASSQLPPFHSIGYAQQQNQQHQPFSNQIPLLPHREYRSSSVGQSSNATLVSGYQQQQQQQQQFNPQNLHHFNNVHLQQSNNYQLFNANKSQPTLPSSSLTSEQSVLHSTLSSSSTIAPPTLTTGSISLNASQTTINPMNILSLLSNGNDDDYSSDDDNYSAISEQPTQKTNMNTALSALMEMHSNLK